ncbi:entry exclusion protein TrbK [Agrobacterium tumefaciens]|uniref:entry exclusion protein TrbK n=1 Tax=Agrobacterium TaxID=357 RepID=UPI00115CECE5|nr:MULTISPECIES: entry exclusion protein TrbK [Agrobacterium]MDA5241563.1 entry exclusion protein TrbK [Agrobacterium sp. MAFF310724]MDA5249333.1 entry exclusion protein TrbK [Agrobacterium sp. MAFF210268]MDO3445676.1 entry exclusion protein TrbK [Agrobacterium sp. V1]TRB13783.1 entry exclusion protein TrbK [Agrobacterium tumefaciens]UNZ54302.1 entry exclusion protein TrbK [Agrobacterium tumefaciens]
MSPRLIVILVLVGLAAVGAGVGTWIVIQPRPAPVSGSGAAATHPVSETERREHREKFFSGDPDRDIRGGQEMKPRW